MQSAIKKNLQWNTTNVVMIAIKPLEMNKK